MILLTGATGKVGGQVVIQLMARQGRQTGPTSYAVT